MTAPLPQFPHATENNTTGFPANARVFHLTPKDAQRMLQYNRHNRPLSENYIDKLMSDMRAGRYTFNGETIKFAIDGELLDGQHRLVALSRMPDGTTIPFLVVFGLDRSTQDTMDQGRIRSSRDQLVIDGISADKSGSLAAAVRVYLIWKGELFFSDKAVKSITNPEVVQWARQHPFEIELFNHIIEIPGVKRIKARTGVVLAVLAGLWMIDSDDAHRFTQLLITGAGLEVDDPIYQLRDRLDRIRAARTKLTDREILALFVIAWNHWRKGHSLQKLQLPRNGLTEDSFPVAR